MGIYRVGIHTVLEASGTGTLEGKIVSTASKENNDTDYELACILSFLNLITIF